MRLRFQMMMLAFLCHKEMANLLRASNNSTDNECRQRKWKLDNKYINSNKVLIFLLDNLKRSNASKMEK